MNVQYSDKTLQLGRLNFHEHYQRYPDESELLEYVDALLRLGLALLR